VWRCCPFDEGSRVLGRRRLLRPPCKKCSIAEARDSGKAQDSQGASREEQGAPDYLIGSKRGGLPPTPPPRLRRSLTEAPSSISPPRLALQEGSLLIGGRDMQRKNRQEHGETITSTCPAKMERCAFRVRREKVTLGQAFAPLS
jgi:hypothetical protein